MRIKILIIFCVCSFSVCLSNAQTYSFNAYLKDNAKRIKEWPSQIVKKLKVGDTVPDFSLQNVQNWKSKDLKLSNLNKDLIIIDLWGLACSYCVASMPELEALQKKYDKNIQIILATRDKQAGVDWLKESHKNVRLCKLPMYNNDQEFFHYFQYFQVPYQILIDRNRVIKSLGTAYVNEEVIDDFLSNRLVAHSDPPIFNDFDYSKSALVEGNGRNFDKVQYYSSVLTKIDGIGTTNRIQIESDSGSNEINKIILNNIKLLDAFKILVSGEDHALIGIKDYFLQSPNRIKYLISDSSRFFYTGKEPSRNAWQEKYEMGYELKVPPSLASKTFSFMRTDLERYFGMTAHIKEIDEPCWVIKTREFVAVQKPVEIPEKIMIGNNEGNAQVKLIKDGSVTYDPVKNLWYLKNVNVATINYFFEGQSMGYPQGPIIVVDDLDQKHLFNIVLRGQALNEEKENAFVDFATIKKDLAKSGLMIKEGQKNVPMLVIEDLK